MGEAPQAKIRLEKRVGREITVIAGLHTFGSDRLEKIAKELKTKLGCGGTVKNGIIEIQGNKMDPVKEYFRNAGV